MKSSTSKIPMILLTSSESETSRICMGVESPCPEDVQRLNQKLSSEEKSLCHLVQVTTFGHYTSHNYNPWENRELHLSGMQHQEAEVTALFCWQCMVTPECCSAHSFFIHFIPNLWWTVMNNEWLIAYQMFGVLYFWSCQSAGWPVIADRIKKNESHTVR